MLFNASAILPLEHVQWRVFYFILKAGVFIEYYPNVACFKMLAEQVTRYSFCKKWKRILLNKLSSFFVIFYILELLMKNYFVVAMRCTSFKMIFRLANNAN